MQNKRQAWNMEPVNLQYFHEMTNLSEICDGKGVLDKNWSLTHGFCQEFQIIQYGIMDFYPTPNFIVLKCILQICEWTFGSVGKKLKRPKVPFCPTCFSHLEVISKWWLCKRTSFIWKTTIFYISLFICN